MSNKESKKRGGGVLCVEYQRYADFGFERVRKQPET